jgi:phosphate:Na+ symporter
MGSEMNFAEIVVGLLGGLAVFLFGMHQMSEALKAAAGEGLTTLLAKLTTNRFSAAATGAVVTAIIQSSSVTTVLVVGFVSAGLMTLVQSVGVIMGANIGTTVTAQIVAFKVTKFAWAMIAVGFGLGAFSKREDLKHYGTMIFGLGLLFLGMDQMSFATSPLRNLEPFIALMQRMDIPVFGMLIGAVFTALVQSSSATTGIVIMLASQGFLTLEAGIALAIGANIGTCFTAVLSAIGKPAEAIRAAVVHVLFNVIGALLWVFFIPELAEMTRAISPSSPALEGVARLAADTPREIANANTIFNVANTILLLGFAGPIARLAVRLVPDRPAPKPDLIQPKFLDEVYLQTPLVALDRVRLELGHMGQQVVRMLDEANENFNRRNRSGLEKAASVDRDVDELHRAVLRYVRDLGREELTETVVDRAGRMVSIANYLESTGDLVSKNLIAQALHLVDLEDVPLPSLAGTTLAAVVVSLRDVLLAIEREDSDLARSIIARKPEIKNMAGEELKHLGRLVRKGGIELEVFRIAADVVGQADRLFHDIRKIAEILAEDDPADGRRS